MAFARWDMEVYLGVGVLTVKSLLKKSPAELDQRPWKFSTDANIGQPDLQGKQAWHEGLPSILPHNWLPGVCIIPLYMEFQWLIVFYQLDLEEQLW